MKFIFKNKNLLQLYQEGKDRKYKLQRQLINKFSMAVQHIEAANDIYDLRNTASFKFEKLEGLKNTFSIRLNIKYRLILEIEWENEEKTKGTFYIIEISKHYGD